MKLLILDRDGVINYDSDAYIKSVEEWIPLPGSIEAIAQLSKAGWTVAVATNQSGIARGYYDIGLLNINRRPLKLPHFTADRQLPPVDSAVAMRANRDRSAFDATEVLRRDPAVDHYPTVAILLREDFAVRGQVGH